MIFAFGFIVNVMKVIILVSLYNYIIILIGIILHYRTLKII